MMFTEEQENKMYENLKKNKNFQETMELLYLWSKKWNEQQSKETFDEIRYLSRIINDKWLNEKKEIDPNYNLPY